MTLLGIVWGRGELEDMDFTFSELIEFRFSSGHSEIQDLDSWHVYHTIVEFSRHIDHDWLRKAAKEYSDEYNDLWKRLEKGIVSGPQIEIPRPTVDVT